METVLLFVTIASTAIALAAAFLVWRMRNREEARQRARVAALAAAINGPALAFDANASVDEPVPDPAGTIHAGDPEAQAQGLFSEPSSVAPPPRRGPALAAVAAAAVVLVTGALMISRPGESVPRGAGTAPLELLALQQQQDGTRTVISGLVRNPPAGQPVRRLNAVVLFYDQAGGLVTSSRAPLDYTMLRPGEESPFSVSLQDHSPSATRYRLSFRLDDSGVVPHVDRREKS